MVYKHSKSLPKSHHLFLAPQENAQESSDGSIRKFITKLGPGDLDKNRKNKRKITLSPGDFVKRGSKINVVHMKCEQQESKKLFNICVVLLFSC